MQPLRAWRAARLMSVRDLARAAGVSTKTVVQLEHGRQAPTYATMRKLCAALGAEPAEVAEFAAAVAAKGGPAGGTDPLGEPR